MNENNTTTDSRIARRSVLASIGVSTAALAGCTSDSPSDSSNNSTDDGSGLETEESDVFTAVEMGETDLEIEVEGDLSVEFIDLVDPDGELYDQERLEDDETEVSFEILGRYDDELATGEYELVALEDDEQIESTTITLDANCEITDVLWAAEHPDMDWETDSSVWETHAAIVVENDGTIPSLLTEIEWTDAPVARLQSTDSQSYHHEVRLPPGETIVYSEGPVYRTENALRTLDCGELGTESMTATAVVQVGPDPSYTQQIEYGDDQSCDLAIVEGSLGESIDSGGDT